MDKKIKVAIVVLLSLAIIVPQTAAAKPWDSPKNNDKFQSFRADFTFSTLLMEILLNPSNWEFTPSAENPNKLVVSFEESMASYSISVGENEYTLWDGEVGDFTYEGIATYTAYQPDTLPFSDKMHFRVDYVYDFSAVPGGIDGTLELLYIVTNGGTSIRSLSGTGDLQNVQVQATQLVLDNPPAGVGAHTGVVLGWPE